MLSKILSHARKHSTKYLSCDFNYLIFELFKTRNTGKYLNIKKSMQDDPGTFWFDDNNFYFLSVNSNRQIVLNTLKKLLHINKKITFKTLSESLMNYTRASFVPRPELFYKILDLQKIRYDKNYIYYSGHQIDLQDGDKKIIKMFRENGDFLGMWECMDLAKQYDIKEGSLAAYLYAREIVKKDGTVFYLFGTEFDEIKYERARKRALQEKIKNADIDLEVNWVKDAKPPSVQVDFKLTKLIDRTGRLYIPLGFSKILDGKYNFMHKNKHIEIVVSSSAIWGLKDLELTQLKERIQLIFIPELKLVKLVN